MGRFRGWCRCTSPTSLMEGCKRDISVLSSIQRKAIYSGCDQYSEVSIEVSRYRHESFCLHEHKSLQLRLDNIIQTQNLLDRMKNAHIVLIKFCSLYY